MDDPIIVFLALLAVACQVFVAGTVLFAIASLVSATARDRFRQVRLAIAPIALPLALVVAIVTMTGSLYMSEVKDFIPCRLCWVQRALLYPQVLLVALLLWRPLASVRRVAITLLALCIPVSIYHYLLEWYPSLESSVCDPNNPCTLVWFREFGYVSLPLMALSAALTILVLLMIDHAAQRTSRTTEH